MEKSRKRWVDFEITRIRLEPEQAVLSCCDSVNKGELAGEVEQCWASCIPAGTAAGTSS